MESSSPYGRLVLLPGFSNRSSSAPEDLNQLAEVGEGSAHPTKPSPFGKVFGNFAKGLAFESSHSSMLMFPLENFDEALVRSTLSLCLSRRAKDREFRVFFAESKDPVGDGFIRQWRFISDIGWEFYFRCKGESESQPMSIMDGMIGAMADEKDRLLEKMDSRGFAKMINCGHLDGGFYPSICVLSENDYFGIYRLWTKVTHRTK